MANDDARELLETARALIADPAKWTKGQLRKAELEAVDGGGLKLTERMCAIGAVLRALGLMEESYLDTSNGSFGIVSGEIGKGLHNNALLMEARLYLEEAIRKVPAELQPQCDARAVESFNDQTSHESVMAMFDIAIKDAINEDDFNE